jgi:hypothetical protein
LIKVIQQIFSDIFSVLNVATRGYSSRQLIDVVAFSSLKRKLFAMKEIDAPLCNAIVAHLERIVAQCEDRTTMKSATANDDANQPSTSASSSSSSSLSTPTRKTRLKAVRNADQFQFARVDPVAALAEVRPLAESYPSSVARVFYSSYTI